MNTENATVAEARGLSKHYGSTRALDGVDFRIEPGRIIGLIGPNGAGKSTALKAMMGLIPFDGSLSVLGRDPRRERPRMMEDVCFIADVATLPRWIRVHQLFDYVAGVHPGFSRERAERFLEDTPVTMKQKVRHLSKGMVVQLHLSLVMAIDARFLILDEPTLGLDILYRKEFYSRLLNDYFDEQRTILITTHQVEEIEHILTDLMFLRDGRLVLNSSVEEIPRRYTRLVTDRDNAENARRLDPLHEQHVFGREVLIFEDADPRALEALGDTGTPDIADLFVAKMKEPQS